MVKNGLFSLLLAMIIPVAWAQTTTTDLSDVAVSTASVEESATARVTPWGMDLTTESKGTSGDFFTNLYPSLNYYITDQNVIKVYPKLVYKNRDDHYTTKDEFVALRYDAAQLFNQETHGFDFSLSNRAYFKVNERSKQETQQGHSLDLRSYFAKQITADFSVENETRIYLYQMDERYSSPNSLSQLYRFYLTPKYAFNSNWFSYTKLTGESTRGWKSEDTQSLLFQPGVEYIVSDQLKFASFFETAILKSRDHRAIPTTNGQVNFNVTYIPNNQIAVYAEIFTDVFNRSGGLRGGVQKQKFGSEVDLTLVAF